jgi:hypothetical protein
MQNKPKSLSKIIKTAILITAILAVIEIVIIYFMMGDKKPKKILAAKNTEEVSKPINTEGIKDTAATASAAPITKGEPAVQDVPKQEAPKAEIPKAVRDTVKRAEPVKKTEPTPKPVEQPIKKPEALPKTVQQPIKKPETAAKPVEQPKKLPAEIAKTTDKKEKPVTPQKKEAPKKKQLSEEEMGDILSRVNAEKERTNSKANCIQVLKTNTSNVENWLQVANYLKGHGFIISGREETSSNVKGVHINAGGSCIKLTIGTM